MRKSKKELLIVVAILIIAAFFRFYQLDSIPSGLYSDEAMNGNDALYALETGNFKLFYPNNNGREGLFINIQALFLNFLGNKAWVLRLVSAIFGTLTVWGLYLLAKELFNRQIGYFSSFLLAISFWHVNFSRIGFRAIMLPFILVFGFYFLWKGLRYGRLKDFVVAGVFGGLGFHTYISYRVAPLIALILFLNYWFYLKKDFSDVKYEHANQQLFKRLDVFIRLFKGFAVFIITACLISLPLLFYFFLNEGAFMSRSGSQLSVFSQEYPIRELTLSTIKTLGMFNFYGDFNWRHNISGSSQLFWPIGALFVIGFIKELLHWLKRKHGHFSTSHTFLFAWFFIMLLPGFLSTEAPHALRTIGVIPVSMVFGAFGLWWLYEKLHHILIFYEQSKYHSHQKHLVLSLTFFVFLLSITIAEYYRYFKIWSKGADSAFNAGYVDIAQTLNNLPATAQKYVIINVDGVLTEIPGSEGQLIPMPAQTVMFLTDTFTRQKQLKNNIFYLTEKEYKDWVKPSLESYVIFLEGKKLDK